jgi:hypothetical protein
MGITALFVQVNLKKDNSDDIKLTLSRPWARAASNQNSMGSMKNG